MLDAYPSRALGWVAYFKSNSDREAKLHFDSTNEIHLRPALRDALVRTLQRFNLGESGEGEYLKKFAAKTGDHTYCRAIELFVAEEQTHSRWFGLLLDKLDAPRLEKHWSDAIFTRVRRAGGLHFELVTFLTAEIVGQKFFSQLARNCPDTLCSAVFSQVVRDESAHIAFHIGTLRHAFGGQSLLKRLRWHYQWKFMLTCAIAIVCLDQADIFRQLRLSRKEFAAHCFETFGVVSKRIWAGQSQGSGLIAGQPATRPAQ
ncbi:hypothetical protein EON80_02740 [bacterium]|nr:MAG: hypothetical protein EON80_02740 [bacterium]